MDPSLVIQGGVPMVLLIGLTVVWREWQADRKKAEERQTAALAEQREDAKAMHQLASDLGKAADAVAHLNSNGIKIDGLNTKLDEIGRQLGLLTGGK